MTFRRKKTMLRHAQRQGHTFYVAKHQPPGEAHDDSKHAGDFHPVFQSYPTAEPFLAQYLRAKHPCVCEMYTATQPVRMFFDIETYHSEKPANTRALVDAVINQAQQVLDSNVPAAPRLEIVVVDGSRWESDTNYKASYHVHVTNVGFDNIATHRRFVTHITSQIDRSVYRPGLLRLPGSHKWNDPNKTPLTILGAGDLRDTLVTVLPPDTYVVKSAQVPAARTRKGPSGRKQKAQRTTKPQGSRKGTRSTRTNPNTVPLAPREVRARLEGMLSAHGHAQHELRATTKGRFYSLINGGPRACLVTPGQTHSLENAYLQVMTNGDVRYGCHHPSCKAYTRVLGNLHDEHSINPQKAQRTRRKKKTQSSCAPTPLGPCSAV